MHRAAAASGRRTCLIAPVTRCFPVEFPPRRATAESSLDSCRPVGTRRTLSYQPCLKVPRLRIGRDAGAAPDSGPAATTLRLCHPQPRTPSCGIRRGGSGMNMDGAHRRRCAQTQRQPSAPCCSPGTASLFTGASRLSQLTRRSCGLHHGACSPRGLDVPTVYRRVPDSVVGECAHVRALMAHGSMNQCRRKCPRPRKPVRSTTRRPGVSEEFRAAQAARGICFSRRLKKTQLIAFLLDHASTSTRAGNCTCAR
jgi:hypothetical protein